MFRVCGGDWEEGCNVCNLFVCECWVNGIGWETEKIESIFFIRKFFFVFEV
jgi:hypothetical protein